MKKRELTAYTKQKNILKMCSYNSATINSSLWPIGIRTWWTDTLSNNMTHLNVLNHEGKMRKSWHLIE